MGRIYKIYNNINDKLYVGMTTRTIDERWAEHTKAVELYKQGKIKNESKLYKAMAKYGIDAFGILEIQAYETNDRNELGEFEKYWIEKLNTVGNGYNISPGGGGGALFKGHHHSNESKNKQRMHNAWLNGQPQWVIDRRMAGKTNWWENIKTGEVVYGRKNIDHDYQYWINIGKEPLRLSEDERIKLKEELEINVESSKNSGYKKMRQTQKDALEQKKTEFFKSIPLGTIKTYYEDGWSINHIIINILKLDIKQKEMWWIKKESKKWSRKGTYKRLAKWES